MTRDEMVRHLRAVSEEYKKDAELCTRLENRIFFEAKAEAFATAAGWVEWDLEA